MNEGLAYVNIDSNIYVDIITGFNIFLQVDIISNWYLTTSSTFAYNARYALAIIQPSADFIIFWKLSNPYLVVIRAYI